MRASKREFAKANERVTSKIKLEPKFDIKKGDFYVVENLLLEFALALLTADARAKGMGVKRLKVKTLVNRALLLFSCRHDLEN